MVVIRLARGGRKGSPVFKVMVADKDSKLTGRFLEKIGTYFPRRSKEKTESLSLDLARYEHWVKLGAEPSERLATIIQRNRASIEAASATPAAPAAQEAAPTKKAAAPTKAAAPAKAAAAPKKTAKPSAKAK